MTQRRVVLSAVAGFVLSVVLACDVSSLQSVVVELHSENVYLEHIYDY